MSNGFAQWLGRLAAFAAIYIILVIAVALLGGDQWAVRWFFVAFLAATLFEVSIGRRIHALSRQARPCVTDHQPKT